MSNVDSLAIDAEAPAKLTLLNPETSQPIRDKDGNEAYILLLGTDSKAAQKHRREAMNRQLSKRNRNKMTAEEVEASAIEQLVALTRGWHLVNFAGDAVEFPFSEANARTIYSTPQFSWIKEQVDEFCGDRGNFMRKSSKPSESGEITSSP